MKVEKIKKLFESNLYSLMVAADFDTEMIKYAIDDHFENKRNKIDEDNGNS